MKSAEKLAYFFDASDLRSVFADWPSEIGLVLCMDDEGGCEMLLHHADEGREVIRRIAAVLGRPVGQFAVVPEVEGLPTRRVMFSDEQKLLKLVAAEKDLPELAGDHLLNFRYEVERRARKTAERVRDAGAGDAARWRPRFHLFDVRPKARRAPPAMAGGYVRANEVRDKECRFAEGVLSHGRRGVRLVIAPEQVTARTHAVRLTELAFRDDFSRFVIPREAVGPWPEGEALVLDMADDLFPAALLHRLTDRPRRAEVTVTGHGVFVAPLAVIEEDALTDDAAAPVPVKRPRRWRMTPLRAAMVVMTAAGLMTGSVMRAVDVTELSPPQVLWAQK